MGKNKIVRKATDMGGVVYNLTLSMLSVGELIAMKNALAQRDTTLSNQVLTRLNQAINDLGDNNLTKELDSMN